MNERIKELREHLGLTLKQFADKVGVTRSAIGHIERGDRSLTNQMFTSICREFDVNEEWLRTGNGDMFILQEDETASYVSDLLTDTDNPFYDLIKAIMKTYNESNENEKIILKSFAKELRKNIEKKSRD